MCIGLRVKCSLFLPDFNKNSIFSTDFSRSLQILNFTKICPVGTELFHADRQTDMMKLIVAFRDLAYASKNDAKILFYPSVFRHPKDHSFV